MSYFHKYRKPYIRRHGRYDVRGRVPEPIKYIAISAIVILVLGNLKNSWPLILIAGLVYAYFKIYKWIDGWVTSRVIESNTASTMRTEAETALLNSERHGCKCYMEGLTKGEQGIAQVLSEGLSYGEYFIFNNLTIPSDRTDSSQIDHLVVSKFGVFVIESKDLHGWVFGSKEQNTWTLSLPGGTKHIPFQNPIRQNWSHIMSLRSLLPLVSEHAFKSIVVFTEASEMKTPAIENVVQEDNLVECIKKYAEPVLSENELHTVIGKIAYVCQTVDITPEQHIDNLQRHHPEI